MKRRGDGHRAVCVDITVHVRRNASSVHYDCSAAVQARSAISVCLLQGRANRYRCIVHVHRFDLEAALFLSHVCDTDAGRPMRKMGWSALFPADPPAFQHVAF